MDGMGGCWQDWCRNTSLHVQWASQCRSNKPRRLKTFRLMCQLRSFQSNGWAPQDWSTMATTVLESKGTNDSGARASMNTQCIHLQKSSCVVHQKKHVPGLSPKPVLGVFVARSHRTIVCMGKGRMVPLHISQFWVQISYSLLRKWNRNEANLYNRTMIQSKLFYQLSLFTSIHFTVRDNLYL